jgi:hypothetical protein
MDKHGSGVLTLADGTVHEFKGTKPSVVDTFFEGEVEAPNSLM